MKGFRLSICLAALAGLSVACAQDHPGDDIELLADDALLKVLEDLAGDALVIRADPLAVADSVPQRIDLFVAYTPAARAYAGSTNAMRAAINTYVAATNTAYINSDINVVLKLVGTAEASYTENGDMSTDLSRLRSTTDSFLTTVPGLRETYKADLVCLIRRDGAAGVAGIGYLGNLTTGFAPSAYSVVADIWALGNNSFPHELGHNYGCHHDHANGSGAARSYAYGHRFNGTNNVQYRTIMAYAPGTRISYFSNPSISYQGSATGVSGTGSTAADNARLIEESAVVTRAFRNGGSRLGGMVTGDLNNDGHPDLLLSDTKTGERFLWAMSGGTRTASTVFDTVSANWRLVGTGDFSADSKTDLVWENTSTGARAIWLMNGTTRSSSVNLGVVSLDWTIAAVGDFNADDKPDLVFDNTRTGARAIWLMNGTTRISALTFATVSIVWRIGAAGDFNADGKTDLIWNNVSTGQRAVWFMNGTTAASTALFTTVAKDWRVVGAPDCDGDGKPDLVWENLTTNARGIWFMNGVTRTSSTTLAAPES